jgi:hypothetical protein
MTTTQTTAQAEQAGTFAILKGLERDGLLDGFLNSLSANELATLRQDMADLLNREGMEWGPVWPPLDHGMPQLIWGLK